MTDGMTYELCANCGSEECIQSNIIGICKECGREIFPCSECPETEDGGHCSWNSRTRGCDYYQHSDSDIGVDAVREYVELYVTCEECGETFSYEYEGINEVSRDSKHELVTRVLRKGWCLNDDGLFVCIKCKEALE